MVSPKPVLEFVARKVRRQDGTEPGTGDTGGTEVPASCFDACNPAAQAAQQTGPIPELCDPDSDFMSLYQTCLQCIQSFVSSENSTSTQSGDSTLLEFSPYIQYCNSEGGGANGTNVDIDSLLASWSSLASTQSAIQETLSSLGYEFTTTAEMETDTTAPTSGSLYPVTTGILDESDGQNGTVSGSGDSSGTMSGVAPTESDGQNGTVSGSRDSPGSSNVNVIVPAVVVPVVVVLIAAVVVIWTLIRRRQKRQQLQHGSAQNDGYEGKAQLHADSFRPELEAVSKLKQDALRLGGNGEVAELSAREPVELPAREPVGSEMDASNRDI